MTDQNAAPVSGSILVVGGGISGLTTALEAAEAGYEVFLVEKNPYLGGRVVPAEPVLPEALPPDLRPGDQLPAHQGQPAPEGLHDGRGGEGRRPAGQLHRAGQGEAALRERELHLLRQVRRGLPDRDRRATTTSG
ncbi:MAG: FAD-dependent oxidoreductase [Desulfobacterales bacterium]|nr:FAD-dependent oxidoreductase [Desulfobacterales bacterium]